MTCNCVTHYLEQQEISAIPYAGTTAKELELLENSEPLTPAEARAFLDIVLNQHDLGNDPHNQEIAQCLLEDYAKNRGFDRDRLLLACVQHTAVHRKYGDLLECSRRYGRAMGVATLAQ